MSAIAVVIAVDPERNAAFFSYEGKQYEIINIGTALEAICLLQKLELTVRFHELIPADKAEVAKSHDGAMRVIANAVRPVPKLSEAT